MAKKHGDLQDQYEKILGRPLPYFETLAFRFGDEKMQNLFNALSLRLNLRGLLYDSNDTLHTVQIVFDKASQNILQARRLAGECGAQEISPIF